MSGVIEERKEGAGRGRRRGREMEGKGWGMRRKEEEETQGGKGRMNGRQRDRRGGRKGRWEGRWMRIRKEGRERRTEKRKWSDVPETAQTALIFKVPRT